MALCALSFVVVLFAVYHWFGVFFVVVPVMAAPLVFVVLHFRSPWEGALTYRVARNCLFVLVLSLVAAVAWLETVGLCPVEPAVGRGLRSEERRGGKECVSTCGSRWSTSN